LFGELLARIKFKALSHTQGYLGFENIKIKIGNTSLI
jgi:hypothetical protein